MAKKADPLATDDPNATDAAIVPIDDHAPPAPQTQPVDPALEAEILRQTAEAEEAERRRRAADEANKRVRDAANIRKRAAAAAAVGTYQVSFEGKGGTIEARDADEARAKFNEARKTSYGPKHPGWSVQKVA